MKVTKKTLGRAIQFANVYGLDKESMEKRMEWAELEGIELAEKIVHQGYFPEDADKPYQAIVAAHEWLYPGKAGIDLVCHVDGTCNGLQHGAANTGHEVTAQATNCRSATREDKPEDIYLLATETLIRRMEQKGAITSLSIKNLGRKLMKQPIMTTSYGAGLNGVFARMMSDFTDYYREMVEPEKELVKEAVGYALDKHAGAIIEMTKQLQNTIKDDSYEITWITQDGFKVVQKAREKAKENRVYVGGGEHTTRIDGVSDDAQASGIGPNYVHSQDSAMLRETLRTCNFDIVGVHDSYGTRSENWIEMYHRLRRAFVTIHEYDQGETVRVAGEQVPVRFKKVGKYRTEEVLKAPYFFS